MRGQQRGAQERRREGGTRKRRTGRKRSLGLLVVRQQELGWYYRGMRWKEACYGATYVMEWSCAVARGRDINSPKLVPLIFTDPAKK
jgi:hypothetical protein